MSPFFRLLRKFAPVAGPVPRLVRSRGRKRTQSFAVTTERLEERILLAQVSWATDGDGFWDVAANWSTGQVPTSADDVVIDRGAANAAITIRNSQSVQSLVAGESILIAAGVLTVSAASQFDGNLTLNGGELTADGAITLNGSTQWSAGTIAGTGGVTNAGALTISGNPELLTSTLTNTAAINQTSGTLTLTGSTLVNAVTGTYDLQGDGGLGGTGTLSNSGTFQKSGGSGTATVGVALNNAGTVQAGSGTLSFGAAVSQVAGTTLTGGTWNVLNSATLNLALAGSLTTNQGTVTLSGPNSTFAAINSLTTNAGTFSILAGRNFTVASDFTNSGTLTVGSSGTLQISNRAFINQAGGILDLQNDAALTGLSRLDNAGAIRKSGLAVG